MTELTGSRRRENKFQDHRVRGNTSTTGVLPLAWFGYLFSFSEPLRYQHNASVLQHLHRQCSSRAIFQRIIGHQTEHLTYELLLEIGRRQVTFRICSFSPHYADSLQGLSFRRRLLGRRRKIAPILPETSVLGYFLRYRQWDDTVEQYGESAQISQKFPMLSLEACFSVTSKVLLLLYCIA